MKPQANVETQVQAKPSRMPMIRTGALILVVILVTLACAYNSQSVQVWPIGTLPLFVIILLVFALGIGMGFLLHSAIGGRKRPVS